jgi:hypothetical protein
MCKSIEKAYLRYIPSEESQRRPSRAGCWTRVQIATKGITPVQCRVTFLALVHEMSDELAAHWKFPPSPASCGVPFFRAWRINWVCSRSEIINQLTERSWVPYAGT